MQQILSGNVKNQDTNSPSVNLFTDQQPRAENPINCAMGSYTLSEVKYVSKQFGLVGMEKRKEDSQDYEKGKKPPFCPEIILNYRAVT